MSREVVIYTTMFCPYCQGAKTLLTDKGVAFHEIPVDGNRGARQEMSAKASGRTTVPQIFVGEDHVGGYDDLHRLETAGQLDAMLHERTG